MSSIHANRERPFGLPISRYADPADYADAETLGREPDEGDIDPRMLVLYECPVCGCIEQREGVECYGYPGAEGEGHEDTEMVPIRLFREEPVKRMYDGLRTIHEAPVAAVFDRALSARAAGPWPDDWMRGETGA